MGIKDILIETAGLLDPLDHDDGGYDDDYDYFEEFIPDPKPLPWWFKHLIAIAVIMLVVGLFVRFAYYDPPSEYAIWTSNDPDADRYHIPLEAGTYELWVYKYKPENHLDFEVVITVKSDYTISKDEGDFEYKVYGTKSNPGTFRNMGSFNLEENATIKIEMNQNACFLIIPSEYPERLQYTIASVFTALGGTIIICGGIIAVFYTRFVGT